MAVPGPKFPTREGAHEDRVTCLLLKAAAIVAEDPASTAESR
jgi:hypothetical protein